MPETILRNAARSIVLMSELTEAKMKVPFNRPVAVGSELRYIEQALKEGHLFADGPFTKQCQARLNRLIGSSAAFLTTSGSSALEMAALVADIKAGDEIILPSFTFLTTASAFALRGAVPVFVDIRKDNLNLDEELVAQAIGPKTRAIVPVHYAGVCCNMDALQDLARKHALLLIEDAAHAFNSKYKGKAAGSFADLSVFSFHAAKNLNSGEGGALLVNNSELVQRAWTIWDKGTDKRRFLEGDIDFYSWTELSSSFAPSEITAAILFAQLEEAHRITDERMGLWNTYYEALETLENKGLLRRPIVGENSRHNGHIFYILLEDAITREKLIEFLESRGVSAQFHFMPLHLSPAGMKFGRTFGNLSNTEELSARVLRLPIWSSMDAASQEYVCMCLEDFFA